MMESTAEQNKANDTQHVSSSASPVELDATLTSIRRSLLSNLSESGAGHRLRRNDSG